MPLPQLFYADELETSVDSVGVDYDVTLQKKDVINFKVRHLGCKNFSKMPVDRHMKWCEGAEKVLRNYLNPMLTRKGVNLGKSLIACENMVVIETKNSLAK